MVRRRQPLPVFTSVAFICNVVRMARFTVVTEISILNLSWWKRLDSSELEITR